MVVFFEQPQLLPCDKDDDSNGNDDNGNGNGNGNGANGGIMFEMVLPLWTIFY